MRNPLARIFSLDTRTLALYRVTLALLVLTDLAMRARDLTAHYTDAGILTRAFALAHHDIPTYFRLYYVSGDAWWTILLFALTALAALMLLLGHRTRVASILLWFLITSLHLRNPGLLNAGDGVLRAFLLWSAFLPLARHYSLDRARASDRGELPNSVLSFGTAAALLQVIVLYLFAWALKDGLSWHDGTAIWRALSDERFATPIGEALLRYDALLPPLTHAAIWIELIAPLLLLIPYRNHLMRVLAYLALTGLHVGIALTMEIGIFPFICLQTLLLLLPAPLWDRLERHLAARNRGLTIYYDGGCGFCSRMVATLRTFLILPGATVRPAFENERAEALMHEHHSWVVTTPDGAAHLRSDALRTLLRASPVLWPLALAWRLPLFERLANRVYRWISHHRPSARRLHKWSPSITLAPKRSERGFDWIAGALIAYLALWNVADHQGWPAPAEPFAKALQIQQNWRMFAPEPGNTTGAFMFPTTFADGLERDALWILTRGTQEDPRAWPTIHRGYYRDTYPTSRWNKYLSRSLREDSAYRPHLIALLEHLCRTWNASNTPGQWIERIEAHYEQESLTVRQYRRDPQTFTLASVRGDTCRSVDSPVAAATQP